MAFRLKSAKSIGAQLARIVAGEARQAVDEIASASPVEQSIHEARKHVKKIRSVLHLLRKQLGGDYARLNAPLRSAAHQMAAARDADALVAVLKALRRRYRGVMTPSVFQTADATLRARRREAYARLTGRGLAHVRQTLRRSRRALRPRLRRVATRRTMRDGVERGYRRARGAMAEATVAATDHVRLHTWRRRVKDHWYQMRLVEGVNGRAHARVRRLKRLQDWLGDHHNLVLLQAAILEQPQRFGDTRGVAVILGCIDQRRAALRRRAVRRGRQLFSRKPRSFRKQIRSWWR